MFNELRLDDGKIIKIIPTIKAIEISTDTINYVSFFTNSHHKTLNKTYDSINSSVSYCVVFYA